MSLSDAAPATICAAFQATVARQPDQIALRTVGGGTTITWAQYAARVREIAAGLAALGVRRGDTVALLLTNRPEFHLVDTAAQHLGAVPFSCYNTSSPEQIAHLLADSGAQVAVTESRLAGVLTGQPLRHVVVIDGEPGFPAGAPDFDFDAAWPAVTPDDLLTLVYTSGTTGPPKGVEITHAGMAAMARASAQALGVRAGDRLISFLPSAHIADRWANHYLHSWTGTQVTCLSDHREILAALRDVRPTLFGAVPQVWQRIAGGIHAMLAGQPVAPAAAQVRAGLGLDQARIALTSAAPALPAVVELINAIGVPLSDAWGMSELSGIATVNPVGANRPGSVGLPIPGLETRLAVDGELLVRGPVVMRGYRGLPAETLAAVDIDGWLHTGDLATIDDDGYVRIVDRKKDLIITAGGENISPAAVELAVLTHCPQVAQAVIVGDGRPYLVALLVLSSVEEGVEAGIEAANATLSRPERIRAYTIVTDEWQPGGELLTATMKVRRRPVLSAYAEQIEKLYQAGPVWTSRE